MLVQGYHPGLEDDAFYLAAIKMNLHPALFPHDADFFRVQFQATIFDKLIAFFIRLTHLPVGWGILLWQFASIFLILWGCWAISRRCFRQTHAQWAAVGTIALLLTLPIGGIALSLTDQYLHPRALATAAILAAIVATLDRRRGLAAMLLGLAFIMHALMASFGISFCLFLGWEPKQQNSRTVALALPLGWIFEPASDAWRQAAATRGFYHWREWEWYEWLGVFAPLVLLWAFRMIGQRNRSPVMARLAERLLAFGVFQLAVGLVIMLTPGLERLWPLEPMRFLHLIYLLMFLLAGGLIGQYALGTHIYRALLLFVPLAFGMFHAQRQMFPATEHFEWPGAASRNCWLQAFDWIRQNTPTDSQFAIDPYYMELPGERLSRVPRTGRAQRAGGLHKGRGHGRSRTSLGRALASRSQRATELEEFPGGGFSQAKNAVRGELGGAGASAGARGDGRVGVPISERPSAGMPRGLGLGHRLAIDHTGILSTDDARL